jgi:hypothetical protein
MVLVVCCVGHAIFWLFLHSYCLVKWMSQFPSKSCVWCQEEEEQQTTTTFLRFAFCRTSGLFYCVPSCTKFCALFEKRIHCSSLRHLIVHGDYFNVILRNEDTLSYVINSRCYFISLFGG